ncbi:hypothetical protein DFAR_4000029 [Desulfarculales bacterium]
MMTGPAAKPIKNPRRHRRHEWTCFLVEVPLENRSHGLLRPLDLAVNCRAKRDHYLLRLESSSTTAPTDGYLF